MKVAKVGTMETVNMRMERKGGARKASPPSLAVLVLTVVHDIVSQVSIVEG